MPLLSRCKQIIECLLLACLITFGAITATADNREILKGFNRVVVFADDYKRGETELIRNAFTGIPIEFQVVGYDMIMGQPDSLIATTLIVILTYQCESKRKAVGYGYYNDCPFELGIFEALKVVYNREAALPLVRYTEEFEFENNVDFHKNLGEKVAEGVKELFEGYTGYDTSKRIDYSTQLRQQYVNWEKAEVSIDVLKNFYTSNSESLDWIEGVWRGLEEHPYTIAIRRDGESFERDYYATILKSPNYAWTSGQVKCEFTKLGSMGRYAVRYYMQDRKAVSGIATVDREGTLNIRLSIDEDSTSFSFVRVFPKTFRGNTSKQPESNILGPLRGSGSGFLLPQHHCIVTNYHVVQGGKAYKVILKGESQPRNASILVEDKHNDIAVLLLESKDAADTNRITSKPSLTIRTSENVRMGDPVSTIGFPLPDLLGSEARYATGVVSALVGIDSDPRVYQVSLPIQPGNSGGPVFDRSGNVIGVCVSTLNASLVLYKTGTIPQSVNFAVKADYLIALLRTKGINLAGPSSGQLKSFTTEELNGYCVQVLTYD